VLAIRLAPRPLSDGTVLELEPGVLELEPGEVKVNLQLLNNRVWQMSGGERAAVEGVLSQLKPNLSVEIGTAEGGSLDRIAAYSSSVHSFDLVPPQLRAEQAAKVTIHTGDSHELLPIELDGFAKRGENVDFVMLDGDHSSAGVRRDLEDLLNSEALATTVILIHDTNNETVRVGLDSVHYDVWPKVAHVDLDFVPGYVFSEERLRYQLWGGLGIVIVDSSRLAYASASSVGDRYFSASQLLAIARDVLVEEERQRASGDGLDGNGSEPDQEEKLVRYIGQLEEEILRLTSVSAHHEAVWRGMMNSTSWKITTPLRAGVALARRRDRT
jgi:hypothetical protein